MRAHHRRAGAIGFGFAIALFGVACDDDGDSKSQPEASISRSTPTSAEAPADAPEATVVEGSGDISAELEEYRTLLGADNGTGPTQHASGRREINWDGVPDELSRPNLYPSDFFNAPQEPRARGIVLESPSGELGVSADSDNPSGAAVRFGDINPAYSDTFTTFSAERLFSPVGSNVVDARFYVPGTDTPAVIRGFGAVYTDVDGEQSADFEFFDAEDKSLGKYSVPVSTNGLSFLGVAFPEAIVARVRIVYGSSELGPADGPQYDVAVMDDFIYGEPQAQSG